MADSRELGAYRGTTNSNVVPRTVPLGPPTCTIESGYWSADRNRALRDAAELDWVDTENWHHHEVSNRGRVRHTVASQSVLIIGAGAVGSAVGELLVRAGVRQVTIMDTDHLAAGNLVRHTLVVRDIESPKTVALARRLNDAAIHSSVTAIDAAFPPKRQEDRDRVLACDVVIDCSANDEVAEDMRRFPWKSTVTFVSLSFGLHAQRLFLYVSRGDDFPSQDFRNQLKPWLEWEIDGYSTELPRDGLGCWHPLLPARVDDVWMMTAAAFKLLEAAIIDPPQAPTLTVLEQQTENGAFSGLRKVSTPESVA